MSNLFWLLVRDELGIAQLHSKQHSYLKKQPTYEESMKKLQRYIEKIEMEDDFMSDINVDDLKAWSDESVELFIYVKKLGYMEMFTNEDFLK